MSDVHEARQRAALALDLDDFVAQGTASLPTGPAWSREPGTVRQALLRGLLGNHAFAWERMRQLLAESDPRSAYETINNWERDCGLPDPCTGELIGLQERREAVVHKRLARGGQSRAYYIAIAAQLGYRITITEFRQFRCGRSAAGDAVNGVDWCHTWRVHTSQLQIWFFRAGSSAGTALRRWGGGVLECILNRLKPGSSVLTFSYYQRGQTLWDGGQSVWDDNFTVWDQEDRL
jgi:uncharacterized protein YmfQ (DUF2313 family)